GRCRPRRAARARLEARAGALRRNGAAGGAAGGLSHMARGVTPLLVAACLGGAAAAAQVPSPASVLGFAVGADRSLADWRQLTAYFNRLAAASDRVKLDTLGTSTLGKPFVLLTISSPANLRRLSHYRDIQRKLADPRTIASTAEREQLLRDGRVIVLITAAIHSIEVGSGQVPVRIAYRSEEHTSELQSQSNLVCRLLLEKKKKKTTNEST